MSQDEAWKQATQIKDAAAADKKGETPAPKVAVAADKKAEAPAKDAAAADKKVEAPAKDAPAPAPQAK